MSTVNPSGLARHHVIAVPNSLYTAGYLATDSEVLKVFSQQKFSRLLQEYLISYSLTVSSPLTLTDESYTILEESTNP
jgi:hypothetical protein